MEKTSPYLPDAAGSLELDGVRRDWVEGGEEGENGCQTKWWCDCLICISLLSQGMEMHPGVHQESAKVLLTRPV